MTINELLKLAKYGWACSPNINPKTWSELRELSKRFEVIGNCDIDELNITVSWEMLKDVLEKDFNVNLL